MDHLAKAHVGNPETTFARTPELSPEFSALMNESVGWAALSCTARPAVTCISPPVSYHIRVLPGFCHSVANASDSAAAFFGRRDTCPMPSALMSMVTATEILHATCCWTRDNVGLAGISQYFKVQPRSHALCFALFFQSAHNERRAARGIHAHSMHSVQVCAVAHRADSWLAIDFLNAHGVNVTFPDIVPPPEPSVWHTQEMSDVLYAFTKVCARLRLLTSPVLADSAARSDLGQQRLTAQHTVWPCPPDACQHMMIVWHALRLPFHLTLPMSSIHLWILDESLRPIFHLNRLWPPPRSAWR